ncbi:MAG: radical SAM protein [bacterium]|nr:radical SAM protein [bacterium]
MSKLHASIIVTYKCNARCNMCEVWKYPTKTSDEITLDIVKKLPKLFFANVTGGEPFIRPDLPLIIEELRKKAKRIVISTNGFFTDKIISLCSKYPDLGIRISIEGLQKNNDDIRQLKNGFDKTIKTLLILRDRGVKDIGFGMTVQDSNAEDLTYLYELSCALGYEFATATLHNSHYFHKLDNVIHDKKKVEAEFKKIIVKMLKSNELKKWFRAYFNFGLINYIDNKPRLLPCKMGQDGFFVDPLGDVLACNGMDKKYSMGNLKEQSWEEIWNSPKAREIRQMVGTCSKNCWMIGSAAPAIWHHPVKPVLWVIKNKAKLLFKNDIEL